MYAYFPYKHKKNPEEINFPTNNIGDISQLETYIQIQVRTPLQYNEH